MPEHDPPAESSAPADAAIAGEGAAELPPGIDGDRLEAWALGYLGRYASSAENLRRVLLRRLRRAAGSGGASSQPGELLIGALIERYRAAGLLDDAAYAEARAGTLHRRGDSLRSIRARLSAKGVGTEAAAAALAGLRDSIPDADLAAACAFARRRRLGPYRPGRPLPPAEDPQALRELGVFARAGFSRRVAQAVLRCPDPDAAEALARDGTG